MQVNRTTTPSLEPNTDLGVTDWHEITQDQVALFAEATFDPDPMHVDEEWAQRHSPFGGTIAFGFQTMALLSLFSHQVFSKRAEEYPLLRFALNYGFDRVRLVAPVPVGSSIRGRFTLVDVRPKGDAGTLLKVHAVVEIEGSERPALVADWLFVAYRDGAAGSLR